MVEIAKRYDTTHRAEYLDAVAQFRLPFWDYFRPRGGAVEFPGIGGVVDKGSTSFPYDYSLPRIFTEKTISARFYPNNELKSLGRNPFHSHKFSDEEASKIEWNIFANDVSAPARRQPESSILMRFEAKSVSQKSDSTLSSAQQQGQSRGCQDHEQRPQ